MQEIIDDGWTWFDSEQMGAPQMNGAAGSEGQMLQILDAVLPDTGGFNIQTVASVNVDNDIVILNYGSNHGYRNLQYLEIIGADDPLLNGRHKVRAIEGNSLSLHIEGVTQVTGIIKTKVAPLGWESIFGNSNPLKRAYRSREASSTKTVLYLDCALPDGHGYNASNPAKRASISMCEDMEELGIQINSYTDGTNDFESNPNGSLFWYQAKSSSKTSSVDPEENSSWVIMGNSKFFLFFTCWTDYSSYRRTIKPRDFYCFGDYNKFTESDVYNCMIGCSYNVNDASTTHIATNGARFGNTSINTMGYFSIKDLGGYNISRLDITPLDPTESMYSGYSENILFPNPSTNSVITHPLYVVDNKNMRGKIPRIGFIPQKIPEGLDKFIKENTIFIKLMYADSSSFNSGFVSVYLGD